MAAHRRDPLLAAARFLLGISIGIMTLVAAGLAIAIPGVLIKQDKVMARVAAHGAPPETIWAIVLLLGLALLIVILGFFFFRHLYRIVDSVGEGEAFTLINAQRLSAMGWIAIAAHVLGIPASALVHWIVHNTGHFNANVSFSLSGILLALILFILARVFRQGTAMREELEGTV